VDILGFEAKKNDKRSKAEVGQHNSNPFMLKNKFKEKQLENSPNQT